MLTKCKRLRVYKEEPQLLTPYLSINVENGSNFGFPPLYSSGSFLRYHFSTHEANQLTSRKTPSKCQTISRALVKPRATHMCQEFRLLVLAATPSTCLYFNLPKEFRLTGGTE